MFARITSALIAGAMLVTATCAWAQMVPPDTVPAVAPDTGPAVAPDTGPAVAPTTAPAMAPTTAPAMAPTTAPAMSPTTAPTMAATMTCRQMMAQQKPLVAQMTDSAQMAMAKKHTKMAQTDLAAGKMHSCENQMKQVMKLTAGGQTP